MVTSSTLIPPSVDAKPSSSSLFPRKGSNASSSGAFSEVSRSFGYEENSSDSFYGLSSSSSPSAHYIIKCNLNPSPQSTAFAGSLASSSASTPSPSPSLVSTPRVKVTVEPSAISTRPSRFDGMPGTSALPSSALLKTPTASNLPIGTSSAMTMSVASSAPEFSISGASSIDDSEELALYEQYLSISHGRKSNPSPEIRKKLFDDWSQAQSRPMPRSKSEVHNAPTEQIQQQSGATASEMKTVKAKISFLLSLFSRRWHFVNLRDYVIVSLLMSKVWLIDRYH